jgi:hypothetical protein
VEAGERECPWKPWSSGLRWSCAGSSGERARGAGNADIALPPNQESIDVRCSTDR